MPDDYEPSIKFIASVTNADRAIVTCTADHGFEDGSWIRVRIPLEYGMEINDVTRITVLGTNTLLTNLSTINSAPFVFVVFPPPFTPAQVIPISQAVDNVGT
jgi:hypothetical protein